MAQELIITSVRKGLDGGSGYQPVLRTQGMKPAIAERLQIRCGYAHPYPHGDSRNPVVYFHRLEKVSGEAIHVVARICDAGSDHTGRSNFLAHLVALQDSETRRNPAGPADAAKSITFKTTWGEQPREVTPLPVTVAERTPGPCSAWQQAGLDPGIAGDLAEAASVGTEVCLITRQNDDILSLFVEALALVAPPKRWQVTFNTCEIEPSQALWRAVREDLPQAKAFRREKGIVDLTVPGIRGSDRAYARFARGEDASLPWQGTAAPSPRVVTDDGPGGLAASPLAKPPQRRSAAREKPQQPIRSSQPPRGESAARSHLPASLPKRNLLQGLDIDDLMKDASAAPRGKRSGAPIILASILVLIVLGVGGFAAYLMMSPNAIRTVAGVFRADDARPLPATNHSGPAVKPPDEAHKANIENAEKRAAEEQKRHQEAELAKKQAEAEQERKRNEAKVADQQKKAAEQQKAQEERAAQKSRNAFAALRKLPTMISANIPAKNTGLNETKNAKPIHLGSVSVDCLPHFGLDLAVPTSPPGSPTLEATLTKSGTDSHTWVINAPDKGIDGMPVEKALAEINATPDSLVLTPRDLDLLSKPPFNMLRRCVVVLRANDPVTKAPYVHPIQLFRPHEKPTTVVARFIANEEAEPLSVSGSSALNPAPLALGGTVEGVITFAYKKDDWSLHHPPIEYQFCESKPFKQSLLVFQKPPPEPKVEGYDMDKETMLCVEVTITPADGMVEVKPSIDGVEHNKRYHSNDIIKHIKGGDRVNKKANKQRHLNQVSNLVREICKHKTGREYMAKGAKTFESLCKLCESDYRQLGGDFGSYFAELPDNKGKDPKECFEKWEADCKDIAHNKADNKEEWESRFIKPLENWHRRWKDLWDAYCDWLEKQSDALYSDIEVRIHKLSVEAKTSDGTSYPVVLLDATREGRAAAGDHKRDLPPLDEGSKKSVIFSTPGQR